MRALLLALPLCLAACAGGPTGPEAAKRFDRFEAVETNDFRSYEQVQVIAPEAGEELQARADRRLPTRSLEREIATRDIEYKLADLREEIEEALAREVELVEEGGPGILTVRTILTQLEANRPTQAELAAQPGLDFNSISEGRASVRIELSEDGRLLAVIEDADNVTGLNDPRILPGAGIWTTADQHFDAVARKLTALLKG
ncbi:DUF3313 family protein [Parvularcula maris]|uniref:DUF3313 domain-containing protein n=1 Tax=Parvularcula maris TaxID=2965077 RepID=A0A9X2LBE8_9PROT|nr:DUF3313 family protein [Parvularcula maris]MCQ8186384.1 DUF3313 domain-containing protein [Parvularcula maris]